MVFLRRLVRSFSIWQTRSWHLWFVAATLVALVPASARAIDFTNGFLPAAFDQPKINVSFSRTPDGPALSSPDGVDPFTGQQKETINIQAYLDTGASGILLSKETINAFGIQLHQVNDGGIIKNVVFSDIGVGGSQDFDVSEELYIRLGATNPFTLPRLEDPTIYTQQFGKLRTQVFQTESQTIIGAVDVVGTPAMEGKVVVIDSRKLNSVIGELAGGAEFLDLILTRPDDFSLRTYIYDPGKSFNPSSDSDPGIPTPTFQIQLSQGDFSRFTSVNPPGAAGPNLSNNPFIGPNPASAVPDSTPKVKIGFNGHSTEGSFLLDTGAAASMISTSMANQLHVFHDDPMDPSSVLVYVDPNTGISQPLDTFELTITGVGGTKTVHGFYLDNLLLRTLQATSPDESDPNNLNLHSVPVLVADISVYDPVADQEITLDGIFGMNLLSSNLLLGSSLFPEAYAPGLFDFITYDQTNGILGLTMVPEPHAVMLAGIAALMAAAGVRRKMRRS